MLGEDTLFFTKKGLKPLKKLNIYDEVLTAFGTFEPIIEMSPWQKVTTDYNVVTCATGEKFLCDDDVLWYVYEQTGSRNIKFVYTDELLNDDKKYTCANIMDMVDYETRVTYNPYKFAVVVPTCVPFNYLISNKKIRNEFLAGLIDSPMCFATNINATYRFYTEYIELAKGIITLARTLGHQVVCRFDRRTIEISLYIRKGLKDIPMKDEYKKINKGTMKKTYKMYFKNVNKLSHDVNLRARNVKVNGGSAVIGYSLIPINCQ